MSTNPASQHVQDNPDAITEARASETVGTTKDKAAIFLESVEEDRSFDYEEEKAVLRRIDFRVLPLLLGAYFFQQLDKSSLSYVSIFGLVEDANLQGRQYSWLGSILYIAQLIMQPLAAFLLVKLPTGKLLGSVIFLWGASQAIMAACTDFKSLAALRFLLGAFEAFIAPICVTVTQMWWRRSEQTLRNSYWNAMNGVTFIVGSLFTYGLGHINSDTLYSYQIIFMFCGILTVTYSAVVFILMPDSPMEAKYLKFREKVIATERLRANQQGIISRKWKWDHVYDTFTDLKTYCWFVLIVGISIPSGGISTFGSLIIRDFGYSAFTAILFNIPFGIVQIFAIIGSAAVATKWQRKGFVISIAALLPITGTISCQACITPLIYAWHVQNTGGDTKRKTTSAVMFMGMCTGNIVGPLLYSVDQAPEYRPGLISNLILFVFTGVMGSAVTLYLMFLNKRHARQREAVGKTAAKVDESMVGKNHLETSKAVDDAENQPQATLADDKGMADVTDLRNEDFIYVY